MSSNDSFYSTVPVGWIKDYLRVMIELHNEMPLPFHYLAACTVIGNMIGLTAWGTVNKGVRVFPNVNALLLSPAGSCRRGEGTKIMVGIARRAGVNIFAGKITPEGLVDEIAERGNLLLYSEELAMLLTSQDHQKPLIPVLTKLLLHGEGPVEVRTRGMGERRGAAFVNLSALFTSAPDWFVTTIPQEAFGGGLMSRFLVCCLEERDVYHIDATSDDSDDKVINKLATSLMPCRTILRGHIPLDKNGQEWLNEWYLSNETKLVEDDRLGPHRNRKPSNLIRIALIHCAAAGMATLTRDRLEQALKVLDWMEPTLVKLYGMTEEMSSYMSRGERRIIRKIMAEGGEILHSPLLRSCGAYFKGGVRDMRKCIEGMLEKGLIEPVYKPGAAVRWPPMGWRLRDARDSRTEHDKA